MANLMAGSLGGYFPDSEQERLEVLSILLNNKCNLSCRHCYLEAPKYPEPELTAAEWRSFLISVLSDIRPGAICFAGKEVFINEASASVLMDAIRLRNEIQKKSQRTRVGVITNATLVHRYRDRLLDMPPDYCDVSIDGLPETHDIIRGGGAFSKLEPNLRWLSRELPGKVWLTHTALNENLGQLPAFVEFYHSQYNINNFSIGFYKTLAYTDQSQTLNPQKYQLFVTKVLPVLSKLSLKGQVLVKMEIDHTQPDLLSAVTDSGWIENRKPLDSQSQVFANGLTLRFDTVRIPVGFWRSVRVTPEGYWVAAEDLIRVSEYDEVAAGTVRRCSYDALTLFKAGLRKRERQKQQKLLVPTCHEVRS